MTSVFKIANNAGGFVVAINFRRGEGDGEPAEEEIENYDDD